MADQNAVELSPAEVILAHVKDGREFEFPGVDGLLTHYALPPEGSWMLFGMDLTPTRHTVMLWVGAAVLALIAWLATRGRQGVPKGRLQTGFEMLFLFVRDEMARANIARNPDLYAPYLASVFFFIVTLNLLGLVPFSATATGSLGVTATLAVCTFVVTQIGGIRSYGVGGYFASLVPDGVPLWLYPLMVPVEILGLFTKPFALMMRLFANMMAGHIILFFLIGLGAMFTVFVAPAAVAIGFAIYLLEIFVALLQAFIFTVLSSLFIGLAVGPAVEEA